MAEKLSKLEEIKERQASDLKRLRSRVDMEDIQWLIARVEELQDEHCKLITEKQALKARMERLQQELGETHHTFKNMVNEEERLKAMLEELSRKDGRYANLLRKP